VLPPPEVKPEPLTRILFVFDASNSMYGRWQTGTRMEVAQRLMRELLDSLGQIERPNFELALRVYGHQKPVPPQDCNDTRLEVAFSPNSIPRIQKTLAGLRPMGTTPIARSLIKAGSDFPECSDCRNIIILITDGVEACDEDPCAASRILQQRGVILKPFVIGIGLESNLAKDFGISREECDAYAAQSHQRAAKAWADGKFADELVSVEIPQKKGPPILFAADEGIRADATPESLALLKSIEKDGVVTAGNASQQNDGASACLVVAEELLEPLGLEPMAWLTGWAAAGCDPSRMGIGPVPAVERLFVRTGMKWEDIDLVELNEAFAPQVLAVLKGWGWHDPEKLNVNGSGISLGHPIGATGGRILATMLNEMRRRDARFGLETMCIGGGQGLAAIFEKA
jgi:hypothetical protein